MPEVEMAADRAAAPVNGSVVLGPLVIVASGEQDAARRFPDPPGGDFVAIGFPARDIPEFAADIRLMDGVAPPEPLDAPIHLAVLAPRSFLAEIIPNRSLPERLPPSAAFQVLRQALEDLIALGAGWLSSRQRTLAAEAVRALLAAALIQAEGPRGLGSRRRASPSDRVTAYIDRRLDRELTTEELCTALGCSRSSLYRATHAAGGVAELVWRRRLIAARERLRGGDGASVAEVARRCGISDPVQFNRRFKALFGFTPGAARGAGAT